MDKFGHQPHFNFSYSNTHNTLLGGIFSICINLFMVVFIAYNLKKWINMEEDYIHNIVKQIDSQDLVVVNLNITGVLPYVFINDVS